MPQMSKRCLVISEVMEKKEEVGDDQNRHIDVR
jgi:hypothetical protein